MCNDRAIQLENAIIASMSRAASAVRNADRFEAMIFRGSQPI
jgi:hypothetical protein